MDFSRLTGLERSLGVPLIRHAVEDGTAVPARADSARRALETRIADAVKAANGQIAVLFSGGRDSSAVLATATAVCRRLGADDPTTVTAVYPNDPATDEYEWRREVLKHLRLTNAVEVEITTERRMLSSQTRSSLEAWGTVWPPAVHTQSRYFDVSPRAVFLTGEGGDGVIDGGRITPLTLVVSDFPRVSKRLLAAAAHSLTPDAIHMANQRRAWATGHTWPWVRPERRNQVAGALVSPRGPLNWGASRLHVPLQRSVQLVLQNTVVAARRVGADLRHPLLDAHFLTALAGEGGTWGYRGRTDAFRRLFGDLLPDQVLARTTKAAFNTSRWGDGERDFASSWTGTGVDHDIIDYKLLREEWLSESPHPVAQFLVHDAWLAERSATGRQG